MSTVGKILGAAGIATGVLGAAALGGVTAQRVSVRRYQSAQSALMTDPKQEHGYGALQADRTYSVDAEDGVALYVEEVGPVTAPITVIFSHGWTLRSGAWHYQRLGLAGPGFSRPVRIRCRRPDWCSTTSAPTASPPRRRKTIPRWTSWPPICAT
jgi:pimeloyl-ACP methyl ester carboxylesterase